MNDDVFEEYENGVFTSFLSISASLKKCKSYKKIEIADMVFIVEDINSGYEFIKPYELFPDILERFLCIEEDYLPEELRGRLHTVNYNLDIKLQHKLADAIVKFANEFGLLGLSSGNRGQKYLKYDIKPDTEYKTNMLSAGFIEPYVKKWYKNKELFSEIQFQDGLRPMKAMDKTLSCYNESVVTFMFELDNIYRHRKNIERFKMSLKDGKKLTENDLYTSKFDEPIRQGTRWKDYFDGFMQEYTGHNLYSMSLEYEQGSFKLSHDCKTLLSALILMHFQDVVNMYQKIRFCENPKCGRAYIAKSKKQKFHDESCGTYVRVNRLRGRDIDI